MNEITIKLDATDFNAAIDRFLAAIGGKAESTTPPAPTWVGEPAPAAPQYPQPVAPSVAPQYPQYSQTTAPQYHPIQGPQPPSYPQPAPPVPQQPSVTPGQVPTQVKAYTLDELQIAAMPLVDAGKRQELNDILGSLGVQALTQLPKERYPEFASLIRSLGAKI